jgi:hypothetical protein
VQELVGEFEPATLSYPWQHPDSRVDCLFADVLKTVTTAQANKKSRGQIFDAVMDLACTDAGAARPKAWTLRQHQGARAKAIPTLSEPWYC